MKQYLSRSSEETFEIGRRLGTSAVVPSVICFFGEPGAGKTTFIKGVAAGAAGVDPSLVQSPTFAYLHLYEGPKTVCHFDLYRLRDADEFLSMGFDEYFEADMLCCVEWSERIFDVLPSDSIRVVLTYIDEGRRLVTITERGENAESSIY